MKAAPSSHDRNTIFRLYNRGESVSNMSSATRVRREHVESIVKQIQAGTFKGPKELQQPVTAMAAADKEIAALKAQLDAVHAKPDEIKPKRKRRTPAEMDAAKAEVPAAEHEDEAA